LVLACVERQTLMHPVLLEASQFVVNVLASGQESLSRRFAEQMEDRFDGIGYTRGLCGAVVLHDVLAYLECDLVDRHRGGDHTIFIGEVIAAEAHPERPLLYYRGGYAQLER
jgi:flavin reductase (DIM6/NTAB) family NADH-FMN oxidoreductase RutF